MCDKLNLITEKIIGCAIEVHKHLGPGLLESIYESALCIEFELVGIYFQRQVEIPVVYKNHTIGNYRLDLLVENEIIVELKAVNNMKPLFEAQLLSYMRSVNKSLGLLINFNVILLKNGIRRMTLN